MARFEGAQKVEIVDRKDARMGFSMREAFEKAGIEVAKSEVREKVDDDKAEIEAVGSAVYSPEITKINAEAVQALDENVEVAETQLSEVSEQTLNKELSLEKEALINHVDRLANDAEEIGMQINGAHRIVEDAMASGGIVPKSLRKLSESYDEGEKGFRGIEESMRDLVAGLATVGATSENLDAGKSRMEELSVRVGIFKRFFKDLLDKKMKMVRIDADKMQERGDGELEDSIEKIAYLNEQFFNHVESLGAKCDAVAKGEWSTSNVERQTLNVRVAESAQEQEEPEVLVEPVKPKLELVDTGEVDAGWDDLPVTKTISDASESRKTLRGGFVPTVIEGGKGKTEIAETGPTGTLVGDEEEITKTQQVPELLKEISYPGPDDRKTTIGEDYLSPEEMRDIGEVPPGMTLPEVVRDIRSGIPEELKHTDRAELESRKEDLKNLPYIESKNTHEVINWRDAVPEGFKEVDTKDIIGSVSAAFTNWSTEYEKRSGRIVDVAQSLIKGNNSAVDRVFHINNAPYERIKLLKLSGPKGDIFIVKDGTHRVAGAKLAEVKQIPAEIENITEATKSKTLDLLRKFEWEKAIRNGLIDGEVIEEMVNGEKVYELKIKKQVLPWADLSLDNFVKMNQAYEMAHPGALDDVKSVSSGSVIPKSVLLDKNLFIKYLAGETDINKQEVEGVSLREVAEEVLVENERMKHFDAAQDKNKLNNEEEALSLRELMEMEEETSPPVPKIVPEVGGESLRSAMEVERERLDKEQELMDLLKKFEGADEISEEDRKKVIEVGDELLDGYKDDYGFDEAQELADRFIDKFHDLLNKAGDRKKILHESKSISPFAEGAMAVAGMAAAGKIMEIGGESLREGDDLRDAGNKGGSFLNTVLNKEFTREHWGQLNSNEQRRMLELYSEIDDQEHRLGNLINAKNAMERVLRTEYGDQFEVNARAQKSLREKGNQIAKLEALILRNKNEQKLLVQKAKDRINEKNAIDGGIILSDKDSNPKDKDWEKEVFPAKTSWWKEHPKLRKVAIGGGVLAGAGLFAGAWIVSKLLTPIIHPFKTLEFLGKAGEKFFNFLDRALVKGDPIGALSDTAKSAEKFFGDKINKAEGKAKGKGIKYSTTE
ncbi:MAG: hypothetical protein P1P90_05950 [Patescibacteria group bacterium]|nr:hypothetical protein [Patescibacteria group bacterium]